MLRSMIPRASTSAYRTLPSAPSFRFLSTGIESSTPSSSSSTAPITPASSLPTEAAAPSLKPKLLPYFIGRTPSGSLPVYADIRSGGSKILTIVRKVDGSVEALRDDLKKHLPDAASFIKPQSRQVILRGDWVRETKEYLGASGF